MPYPFAGVTTDNLLPSLGEAILGAAGTIASAPRQALWGIGPALVGQSGQGPQSGVDLLSRLGMDPNSGMTRAMGFGAEMVGDPMMLMGAASLAGRGVQQAAGRQVASPLAARLEQYAGGGLADTLTSRPAANAIGDLGGQAGARAGAMARPSMSASVPQAVAPSIDDAVAQQIAARQGQPVRAAGGYLEPPSFSNFSDHSPSFLQAPPGPRGYPNFPTPLSTERFMPGAAPTSSPLAGRLQRMTAPPAAGPQINY